MESSKSDAASGKPTAERLVLLITGGASGAPFLFLPVSYPERSLPLETTNLISEVKDTEKRLAAARETAKAACLSTINEELAKLWQFCRQAPTSYCFFNTMAMAQDAARFAALVKG